MRGWKINKTLKRPSNCFKAMGNSWVSLAGFTKMATNLISSKLDNQAAKEQLTEETEGLDSSVHALQIELIGWDQLASWVVFDLDGRSLLM
ncbi:hypothetical protein PVK06_020783 [Gossypium arboreum]|uniref:Uncharacterized protein n=1 Tax=Gossypium arboreum TaxID=29729 RepID=A0ABR0PNA9_GOSAR|nr:hypothetical protein PVK06_020783 [Gossypium arboreum]